MTIPQLADPNVLIGVIFWTGVESLNLFPFAKLIGINMPQPKIISTKNMFRHILKTRRKTVASSPIRIARSCSFVFHTGPTHANTPFPIGGGACFSSATLSFGAYTRELYGRSRENPTASRRVNGTAVTKPAMIESWANCSKVSNFLEYRNEDTYRGLKGILQEQKQLVRRFVPPEQRYYQILDHLCGSDRL